MDKIKADLLSNNEQQQLSAVIFLDKESRSRSKKHRQQFIHQLMRADILWHLPGVLKMSSHVLWKPTLSFLRILADSKLFYSCNIATQTISHILQNGFLIAQKSKGEKVILLDITYAAYILLHRASEFEVPLPTICNISQVLGYITALDVAQITKFCYIAAIARLLRVILPSVNIKAGQEQFSLALKIFQDLLSKMIELFQVAVAKKELDTLTIVSAVLKLSNDGLIFAEVDSEISDSSPSGSTSSPEDPKESKSKPVIKLISNTIINYVIPNLEITDFGSTENQEVIETFVKCLNSLYQLQDAPQEELSWHLGTQGYLNFLILRFHDCRNFVSLICQCLSRVISSMIELNLAIDKSKIGRRGFQRNIFEGLMAHSDSIPGKTSFESLMFLYYFHYHCTLNDQVISFVNGVHEYIFNLSVENLPDIPMLQVTWFFFSISLIENPSTKYDKFVPDSFNRMIEILEKVGVENCYTHHPSLVISVLENMQFPNEIRFKVVKQWLLTDGNVHQRVNPRLGSVIVNCLLNALTTGVQLVVKKAANELHQMALESEILQNYLSEQMWSSLPQLIIDLTQGNETNVQEFLKLLNTMSVNVSMPVAIKCTSSVIGIFDKDASIGPRTQSLVIQQATKMLRAAIEASDERVSAMYPNKNTLVKKLVEFGFQKDDDELSAVCFSCLAALVESQAKFSTKYEYSIELNTSDLCNILNRKPPVNYQVMTFVQSVFACRVAEPVFVLEKSSEEEWKQTLIKVYYFYVAHHRRSSPAKWDFTFGCLAQLLTFYHQHYEFALFECCDYLCNNSIVKEAITCKFISSQFLDFLLTWLGLGLYTNRPRSFVEHALDLKARRDKGQCERVYFSSFFDETVKALDQYISELVSQNALEVKDVSGITDILKNYI